MIAGVNRRGGNWVGERGRAALPINGDRAPAVKSDSKDAAKSARNGNESKFESLFLELATVTGR